MKRITLICILALLAYAVPSSATLNTMTTPSMGLLSQPPVSLLEGQLFSNEYVFIFLEQQHVTLSAPLAVDVTLPGTYTMRSQLVPGDTIPAGTVVNSYYVHANPINQNVSFLTNSIGFTTDELVIGLMLGGPTLASGVPVVGNPGTVYNGPNSGNGFKLAGAGVDTITISADQHTVTFFEQMKLKAITEFRIITTTVPVNLP